MTDREIVAQITKEIKEAEEVGTPLDRYEATPKQIKAMYRVLRKECRFPLSIHSQCLLWYGIPIYRRKNV